MPKYWVPTSVLVEADSYERAWDTVYALLARRELTAYEDFWTYEPNAGQSDRPEDNIIIAGEQ